MCVFINGKRLNFTLTIIQCPDVKQKAVIIMNEGKFKG